MSYLLRVCAQEGCIFYYYVYVRKRVAYFILFAGVVPLVGLLSAAQALGCLGQTVFCPGEAVEPDAERRGS